MKVEVLRKKIDCLVKSTKNNKSVIDESISSSSNIDVNYQVVELRESLLESQIVWIELLNNILVKLNYSFLGDIFMYYEKYCQAGKS